MHNDTFTWTIKDTYAVCGTNWGTANFRGNAHGSAVLSTLGRLPSLSKPSVMREDSQWLCIICGVIKSPLMLWVTRSFSFSLIIVSKHCLLNYFFLIPFLAKAQLDDLRDFWNLISEWGDPVPRRQVASFSVLHTNTALDFFFHLALCERENVHCPLLQFTCFLVNVFRVFIILPLSWWSLGAVLCWGNKDTWPTPLLRKVWNYSLSVSFPQREKKLCCVKPHDY